ncbi:hypothetical protein CLAVI_000324 [Candidatus Clavichlamydia salmonicola]|uniref:hypothetical protein n=1 Tax=Candidatus Clavichlamydia salmonicola TaxID=469812 RepID=UPI001891583B|nr:hypothetical protein [Candidatus Clavichlamydia salmonicola]MBF5050709.1 hypothetical protein [Candidatus Clavichlamydia salmonicola]
MLLDLLQQILMDASNSDLFECVKNMPLEMLIIILQKLPKSLLNKVLLELPHSIMRDLKQRTSSIILKEQLMKEISDKLSALQLLGKVNRLSQKDKISAVLPLSSWSAIVICKSQSTFVLSRAKNPLGHWGPSYINTLLRYHSEIEENIQRHTRMGIRPLCQGEAPVFLCERSQELGYSKDHDLFPLASMVSGYDGFIKRVLVEKCMYD